ncbi:MAG TPA: type VI secretion system contractile sheath small subunit [Campylobacterales bacterium]|jgi:type VI secretion system protein ImpB|nr:type VI secretion system contractile sheath small subunit [Campylobacterales bacterium]
MDKQSESPKERINITYKPKTGGLSEEIEIPYKMMVLGEFNPNEESQVIEDKKVININKGNFNDVLAKQNISIGFSVDDKLSGDEDSEISIDLKINSMKDFSPESIVENVDELKKLMDLRDSLIALKGPLGNMPAFREAISNAISDEAERKKLLVELGV